MPPDELTPKQPVVHNQEELDALPPRQRAAWIKRRWREKFGGPVGTSIVPPEPRLACPARQRRKKKAGPGFRPTPPHFALLA